MTNFADFKNRQKNNASSLSAKMDKLSGKKNYKDDRIWTPSRDKTGNGAARIRFLPCVEGETDEIVQCFSHFFGTKPNLYIENCPTTLGLSCPVCEANRDAYAQFDKETAKKKTKTSQRKNYYYANILVIDDTVVPANNGKVFIFRFGPDFFKKIDAAIRPKTSLDVAVPDPFDPYNGADYIIRVSTKSSSEGEFANYDQSSFNVPTPLFGGDDAKINEVWQKCYPLQPFVAPSQFKSYDELAARLKTVNSRGRSNTESGGASTAEEHMEDPVDTIKDDTTETDPMQYFKDMEQ